MRLGEDVFFRVDHGDADQTVPMIPRVRGDYAGGDLRFGETIPFAVKGVVEDAVGEELVVVAGDVIVVVQVRSDAIAIGIVGVCSSRSPVASINWCVSS